MRKLMNTLAIGTILTASLYAFGGCHNHPGAAEKKDSSEPKTVAAASQNNPASPGSGAVNTDSKTSNYPQISAPENTQAAGGTKIALSPENTTIKFEASKLKPPTTHQGGFKAMTGTATLNGTDLTTLKFDVDIDVNTIYTDADGLTKHLKSGDFFDVAKNPKAKFVSTKVEKDGADYKVTGKLTMHAVTKDVSFPAKLDLKDGALSMSSNFKINRQDWNITYATGNIVNDISLAISVTAKTAP